jgi:hypothetical protein
MTTQVKMRGRHFVWFARMVTSKVRVWQVKGGYHAPNSKYGSVRNVLIMFPGDICISLWFSLSVYNYRSSVDVNFCILFYFILVYFILFYFILFYFILFCFMLFYFISCYFILFHVILFYFIFSVIFNVYSCLRNQAKQFLTVTEYTSVISSEQHFFGR